MTMSAETMLASLQCPLLTKLSLSAPFTSSHMSSLLAGLPLLIDLRLTEMFELESLVFLSRCTSIQGLTRLSLRQCRHRGMHLKELIHLFSLPALADLVLSDVFMEPLDSLGLALFTPPSRAFPAMRHFEYDD